MGEHDSEGADLDFDGVRRWLLDYTGEAMSCAVRSADRVDSSAFYFRGALAPGDVPSPSDHEIVLAVGDGSIWLLRADFVRASARFDVDVDIHTLHVEFRGFVLLVSAGPPPR